MKTLALLCFALVGCVGAEFTVEPPRADGGSEPPAIDAEAAETAKLAAPLPDAGLPLEAEAASDIQVDAAAETDVDHVEEASVCIVANCRCIPVYQMTCCKADETCGCITVSAGDGICR